MPNAVAAAHYRGPREPRRAALARGPFTLTIGELKERKGIHLALEACCRVAPRYPRPRSTSSSARRSGDDYQRGLEARAAAAGLGERVHFLGNVSEDEKVDLLQRAAVFLHTPGDQSSDGGFEGFGIVYLEASAAGVPCHRDAAAAAPRTRSSTARRVCWRRRTAEAVAAALAHLLGDEGLRARMGRAGREHAARSSWERNAREVLALYDEVLA